MGSSSENLNLLLVKSRARILDSREVYLYESSCVPESLPHSYSIKVIETASKG